MPKPLKPHVDKGRLVRYFRVSEPNSRNYAYVEVEIENDGYVAGISSFEWDGVRSTELWVTHSFKERQIYPHIYKWLKEWDLIELRPMGPEDFEYFATATLLSTTSEV